MSMLGDIEKAIAHQDWRRAKTLADEHIVRYPNQSKLHYYAGLAAYHLGELEVAAAQLRSAVALNDQDVRFGILLAQTYDRLLRFEEALEVTTQFLSVRPSDPTLNHLRRGLERNVPERITDAWQKSVHLDHYEVELTNRDEQ